MERGVEKLKRIRDELKTYLFERDDVIDGSFAALLAEGHVLLIGPPGTAKSMLAHEICKRIEGADYFQWLLTKFTTPEEIFGAVSLKGLENDEYRRVTEGKLPEAHIAFLDEVFKASSSILNSLLTIMNERIFHNGREVTETPLITLFGASNELPSEEDELEALYDRFLLRYVVDYIKEDFRFFKMVQTQNEGRDAGTRITLEELTQCRTESRGVHIPAQIIKLLARLRHELKGKGIVLSDRRYKHSVLLLQAKAYLGGRGEVQEEDLSILENVLWRDPGEIGEVKMALHKILYGYKERARELLAQAKELEDYTNRSWENEELFIRAAVEAQTKLKQILSKFDTLLEECRERGKLSGELDRARDQIEGIQKDILDRLLSSETERPT